ncbi:MAG: LysE family translocator [Pseudomonadaceae bacterium]|nr:LysE family translocator [Pseudomonadaceae bacterium]
MNIEMISALMLFAFVSSITPGPNNLMLMASGANFGVRRSVQHILGVTLGFMMMIFLVGMGLAQVFSSYPIAYDALKVVCVVFLVYLAWRIATAAPTSTNSRGGQPLNFMQAALFQWVNPKAWAMAITAISVYTSQHSVAEVLWVAAIFGVINLPCICSWTALGQQIHQYIASPSRLRWFNAIMAIALLLSLFMII